MFCLSNGSVPPLEVGYSSRIPELLVLGELSIRVSPKAESAAANSNEVIRMCNTSCRRENFEHGGPVVMVERKGCVDGRPSGRTESETRHCSSVDLDREN